MEALQPSLNLDPLKLGGADWFHLWSNAPASQLKAEVEPHAKFAVFQALASHDWRSRASNQSGSATPRGASKWVLQTPGGSPRTSPHGLFAMTLSYPRRSRSTELLSSMARHVSRSVNWMEEFASESVRCKVRRYSRPRVTYVAGERQARRCADDPRRASTCWKSIGNDHARMNTM